MQIHENRYLEIVAINREGRFYLVADDSAELNWNVYRANVRFGAPIGQVWLAAAEREDRVWARDHSTEVKSVREAVVEIVTASNKRWEAAVKAPEVSLMEVMRMPGLIDPPM